MHFCMPLAADYVKGNWLFSASLAGYSGYKNERDKPMQLNFELRKDLGSKALRLVFSSCTDCGTGNTKRLNSHSSGN